VARQLRDAFGALLDQRTPFGRLALTHVVLTAGDTLVTVSLAGSLFISISTSEARGRVILYLLLTMAPLAVVAPFLGPVLDRSRGARRAIVVLSSLLRAAMSLVLAKGLGSLLVFPEAFVMLMLSKAYLITKGSLVPMVVSTEPTTRADGELATANARLGLLAVLAGFAASGPAIAVYALFHAPWVARLDTVVFAIGAVVAFRLPVGRNEADARGAGIATAGMPASGAGTVEGRRRHEDTPLGALGPRVNTHPEVLLALSAMSILKGLVGFFTFLLAFELKGSSSHHGAPWYGFMLAASMAGTFLGVLVVPRLRTLLAEPQLLAVSIWTVALAGAGAAVVGGIVIQALVAFIVGVAGSAAKPAFDALVQRYVPSAAQGRAFARFETRLQLVWVLGALLPAVVHLQLGQGDTIIAATAAVAGFSYLTSRRALRHRWVSPGRAAGYDDVAGG
jgi:hypothetical protein